MVQNQEPNLGPINGTELLCAENHIIKTVQAEYFPKEIEFVALKSKSGSKPPTDVSQFNLLLDDDKVLRCRSRINNASISDFGETTYFDAQRPSLYQLGHS